VPKRREPTVLQMLFAFGGPVKGYKANLYVARWLVASGAVGHPLNLAAYCEWWKCSESTALRERIALRASLPPGVDADEVLGRLFALGEAKRAVIRSGNKGAVIAGLGAVPVGKLNLPL